MKKITATCLVIICCITIVLISCKKGDNVNEPPINPPDTSHPGDEKARFNIVSSGCSTIVIDSNYFTGEAIVNADSIPIKVDVSKTGTWILNSDTVNGISFSGKGKLNNKGRQFILIAASGTPAITANALLTLNADTSHFNIYVPAIEKDVVTESVPGDSIYFKATIDNVDYSYAIHNVDPSTLPYAWDIEHDSIILVSYVAPPYPLPPGTSAMGVQGNFFGMYPASQSEDDIKRLFQPGAHQYVVPYCERVTSGIYVTWTGEDGQSWDSGYDSQQIGSNFKIVGLTDGHDSKGKYYVKVKMRFNCKLYAYGVQGMKQLTNGEMVSYFFKP